MIKIPVFYTNFLLKNWMNGRSFGFFIIIRPSAKDSKGVLTHEEAHCRSYYTWTIIFIAPFILICLAIGISYTLWWLCLFYYPIFYLLSDRFRYVEELLAYKKQSYCYEEPQRDAMLKIFANNIATRYRLSSEYTKEKAYLDLTGREW